MTMQQINDSPRTLVTVPQTARTRKPKANQPAPQSQTAWAGIEPDGMGRSWRYSRSKSASNASFQYIPPRYSRVVPKHTSRSRRISPLPPSSQPARQFDHTVGKLETRPNRSSVRSGDAGRG